MDFAHSKGKFVWLKSNSDQMPSRHCRETNSSCWSIQLFSLVDFFPLTIYRKRFKIYFRHRTFTCHWNFELLVSFCRIFLNGFYVFQVESGMWKRNAHPKCHCIDALIPLHKFHLFAIKWLTKILVRKMHETADRFALDTRKVHP